MISQSHSKHFGYRLLILAGVFLLLSFTHTSQAAVESVQIRMTADLGGSYPILWEVPADKVFILEHVAFSDYWDAVAADKSLNIRHAGNSVGGQIWTTTLNYSSNFNTLFRPLKLPAGSAISAPYLDNGSLIVFVYGLLVDVSDLYASVPVEQQPTAEHQVPEGELAGSFRLASPRPVDIDAETSTDLESWQADDSVAVTPATDRRTLNYSLPLGNLDNPLFVRFSARALVRDEYLPRFRFLIPLPFDEDNGAVLSPFVAPDPVPLPEKG